MFVTPDFDRSDMLHYEYSSKAFVSQSFKNGQWPLWSKELATGFPLLSLPSGIYNPLYFLIFFALPMPNAQNIGLAAIILSAAFFTYLYSRTLGLSKMTSLIVAVSFAFSGAFITKIVHFTVIQTASIFPLELYIVEKSLQKKKLSLALLLSLAVGLQVLSGFFQIVLYSLIFLTFYIIWKIYTMKENSRIKKKFYFAFFIAVILGFFIGSVQLLPSWELVGISNRSQGVTSLMIKESSYQFKHFITFIWPYLLGDPRTGTYFKSPENYGAFWENTGYIGLLPLIFAIIAGVKLLKNKTVRFHILAVGICILLMLGFSSPTFFLYLFPPLSLFRVPARWIIFLTFSLCILAGYGLDFLWKKLSPEYIESKYKNLIFTVVLLIVCVNLFVFDMNYHLRSYSKPWLKEPETVKFLKQDKTLYRILSLGTEIVWNEQFLNRGWLKAEVKYKTFLEGLTTNWNMVYGIDSLEIYDVVMPEKYFLMKAIFYKGVTIEKSGFSIDETSKKVLDFENVKYIVSPFSVKGNGLTPVFKTKTNPPYFIYQNNSVMPRAYAVNQFAVGQTPGDQYKILSSPEFNPSDKVILRKKIIDLPVLENVSSSAQIKNYGNQYIKISADMKDNGFVVLSDAYYPGWKTYLNNEATASFAVNINQRAVFVPKGKHMLEFYYKPDSFYNGLLLSVFSLITTVFAFFWLKSKEN